MHPPISPATSDAARFETRAFNLYHGKTFRITRAFFHTNDATPVGYGADAHSLYVQLAPEILVVPVLLIVWDDPEEGDRAVAQIDFTATRQFPASTTSVGYEPYFFGAGPNPSSAVLGGTATPPDEIWSQCGIQIQAIGWLYLGPPNPIPGPLQCAGNFGAGQDYVSNYEELADRIKAQVQDYQFAQVFGSDLTQQQGLHPVIIQYGRNVPTRDPACPGYGGKTDTFAGHIQLNRDIDTATAHELGHVLIDGNHTNEAGNLMTADSTNRNLTTEQCAIARQKAAAYDARLRQFYIDLGLADAEQQQPPPEVTPFPHTPGLSLNPLFTQVCCQHADGRKSKAIATICLVAGGRPASDCNVCCRTKRACPSDMCCAHSTTRYDSVDASECEPEDVVPADECGCCQFPVGDACRKTTLPPTKCTAEGGSVCAPR